MEAAISGFLSTLWIGEHLTTPAVKSSLLPAIE